MAQKTDRAGIFGDSFAILIVKTSGGRHGAERVGPPTPGASGVGWEKRRSEAKDHHSYVRDVHVPPYSC